MLCEGANVNNKGLSLELVELSLDLEQGQDRLVRKVGGVPGSPDGSPAPC